MDETIYLEAIAMAIKELNETMKKIALRLDEIALSQSVR